MEYVWLGEMRSEHGLSFLLPPDGVLLLLNISCLTLSDACFQFFPRNTDFMPRLIDQLTDYLGCDSSGGRLSNQKSSSRVFI